MMLQFWLLSLATSVPWLRLALDDAGRSCPTYERAGSALLPTFLDHSDSLPLADLFPPYLLDTAHISPEPH
jgi:hypothetical protein